MYNINRPSTHLKYVLQNQVDAQRIHATGPIRRNITRSELFVAQPSRRNKCGSREGTEICKTISRSVYIYYSYCRQNLWRTYDKCRENRVYNNALRQGSRLSLVFIFFILSSLYIPVFDYTFYESLRKSTRVILL